MRWNRWGLVLFLHLGFLWLNPQGLWSHPADARSQLRADLEMLYPGILKAVERSDWDRLAANLEIIDPVILETDKVLGLGLSREIHAAVAKKDEEKTKRILRRVIIGGVQSLLLQSHHETQAAEMRRQVRQAFSEFLVLEPELKSVDFDATQRIMGGFRHAYVLAEGDRDLYVVQCKLLGEWLDGILAHLEASHE